MKIFFDHQIFNLQKFGGISNYLINLNNNLNINNTAMIISFFYKNHYLKKNNFSKKKFFYKKVGPFYKLVSKINQVYFDYYVKKCNPDIIHYSYFNEKIVYKSKAKQVITEYDLIKERFYKKYFIDQIEYKKKLFSNLDQIICISENTKKDLITEYNINESKISVIKLAVNKSKVFRSKHIKLKPYILFVGNRGRYKNFINVIKAYSKSEKLKKDFDFVCFGGGNFSKNEENLFRELKLDRKKCHFFEGDEEDLNFFYKKAKIFIFPSLYEGFGLPLLEAMNMECPVLCSNTSCFPEIVNDAAILFDPSDIESIKHSLEQNIYDDKLLIDLKKKGNKNLSKYSWEKCTFETEEIYKKII